MDCISYFQLTTVIQVPFRSGGGRVRIREREGEQRERNREHVSNRQQSPNAFLYEISSRKGTHPAD